MQEIDIVRADHVEIGDYIEFDGAICEVKDIEEVDGESILFVSEDDREITLFWDSFVSLFGYSG